MIRKFDLALKVLKILLLIKQFESLWYVWKPLQYRSKWNQFKQHWETSIKYLWQISKLSRFWAPTLPLAITSTNTTSLLGGAFCHLLGRLYSPKGHWVIIPKSQKVMQLGIRPMFNDTQVRVLLISVPWTVFFFSRAGNWTWALLMLSKYSTREPISPVNNPFQVTIKEPG